MEKNRYVVVSARYWNFIDEKTGQPVSIVKIQYFDPKNPISEADHRGCSMMESTTKDVSLWNKINVLPAVYDLVYTMRPGAKNKPTLTWTDLEYVSQFETETSTTQLKMAGNEK